MQWDPNQPLDPAKLAGFDAIVHLAGKNIAGRWTEQFKREVLESRVRGTLSLGNGSGGQLSPERPATHVSMRFRRRLLREVEATKCSPKKVRPARVFWQKSAGSGKPPPLPASEAGVRVVNLRTGVVLARDGGALKPMLPPFKLGLGGRVGSGQQYWSWISLDDEIGAMMFLLQNDSLRGPVNAVGPAPARNAEFVRALGKVLHRPTIFPLPEWLVKTLLGEMGEELLLTSARVLPGKLQAAGYRFAHADLPEALRATLRE